MQHILAMLKDAWGRLLMNSPLRMAGATAFFASFALPAIMVIIIRVFGLFASPGFIGHRLLQNFAGMIGSHPADGLSATLFKVQHFSSSWQVTAVIFIFLLFVATTLIQVIRDSLNQLWGIGEAGEKGILPMLTRRARAFLVILFTGLLCLALIAIERTLAAERVGAAAGQFILTIGELASMAAFAVWSVMIFRFIPAGPLPWGASVAGALFTGLLLTVGKWVLRQALAYEQVYLIFGGASALVIELLFAFYCSAMFYYGACFAKAWADYHTDKRKA